MTPTSKWMRFVSVSTPSRDFTKYGPTEGSLAKARAASVKLGGRSGLESVRSCSTPCVVPAPQCRQLALLLGADRPWLTDAITSPPHARHSGPRPACRESEARANPMPIRIGHRKLVPKSVPAVRGQPPVPHQREEPNADFWDGRWLWKTKLPAHVPGATHDFRTWQGLLAEPCLKLAPWFASKFK